jgi:hypothetical protein
VEANRKSEMKLQKVQGQMQVLRFAQDDSVFGGVEDGAPGFPPPFGSFGIARTGITLYSGR